MVQRKTQGSDAEDATKKSHFVRDIRQPQTRLGEYPPIAMSVTVNHTFAFHVSMKNMTSIISDQYFAKKHYLYFRLIFFPFNK